MIYFLQDIDGGPIWIGHAPDVSIPRRQLEEFYRRPYSLLAGAEGDRETLSLIYEQFKHLRYLRTAMFSPRPELLSYIGISGASPPPPDPAPDPDTCVIGLDDRGFGRRSRGKSKFGETLIEFAISQGMTVERHPGYAMIRRPEQTR